jgi:hypothetical protein
LSSAPEYRGEMSFEVDGTPRGLTVFECRPPWSDLIGPELTRGPIARFSYVKTRNEWTVYRADRNSKFQRYWDAEPTQRVGELLYEIDPDRGCIFWG